MQDTFARARIRPKAARPSARATIGYLIYKQFFIIAKIHSGGKCFKYRETGGMIVCKIPLLARRTRPSAARDDRVSCIQGV